ncbi:hypothetical protein K4F52_001149 [Lecanicillium sp. MT-2017a]|nr:hypothetical protein K4F52_001149 [Lecanicillium sp. MT-2017a]
MSIVVVPGDASSSISAETVQKLTAQLGFDISNKQDAEDYLAVLRSFEGVLKMTERAPDYIPTELEPHPTTSLRAFTQPEAGQNPFNAWSHHCELQSSAPESSLLQGRSVVIKDNISVGGLPTTCGLPASLFSSPDGKHPISPIDAPVVARILAAGATIKGTSTCEAYCTSPLSFTSATGPVHNAFLHGYTSGGSSSGSGVLVARNKVAGNGEDVGPTVEMAIGSDQAGSVRIPAAYNGIYGLKPTSGLVPYTGATSMTPMVDHLGPMAANLEDIAALLEAIAGYDGFDPRMTPESPMRNNVKAYSKLLAQTRQDIQSSAKPGQGLRVGILKEAFDMPNVTEGLRNAICTNARKYLEAVGATVMDISIPMHAQGPALWQASTRPSMANWLCRGNPSGNLTYLPPHIKLTWPFAQDSFETLSATNAAVVNVLLSERFASTSEGAAGMEGKAHRKIFELRAAYDKALKEVDVLLLPTVPSAAFAHPAKDASVLTRLMAPVGVTNNTCPFNISGHPGLSVPCGFEKVEGADAELPIGMQIVGRRFEDDRVLAAAALYERGRELSG